MFLFFYWFFFFFFFFSSRRRHTRCLSDWSSDVCSSDLRRARAIAVRMPLHGSRAGGLNAARNPYSRVISRPFLFAACGRRRRAGGAAAADMQKTACRRDPQTAPDGAVF